MKIENYFESLTAEVDALKNRVRQVIEDAHWQTDGEWKESVLRQILRRHLPSTATVGRGFVITAQAASSQLDVLICDASKPVIFRDGDLTFATPDAVLGIIEVKSRATSSTIAAAATKLAPDMALVRLHPNSKAFAGIFAFEDGGGDANAYLEAVAGAATRWNEHVDWVCVGSSRFIRYWHLDPLEGNQQHEKWHSYALPGTAPGYFVHNVVEAVSPLSVFSNRDVWFPSGSKERYRDAEIAGAWRRNRTA